MNSRLTDKKPSSFAALEFFLILFAALLFLTLLPVPAHAAAVLSWTVPTTHVNGSPLSATAADVITLTRDGGAPILFTGLTTSYVDTTVADCKLHQWTATFTETATGIASAQAMATQPIDTVGCAPKPVTGFSIK